MFRSAEYSSPQTFAKIDILQIKTYNVIIGDYELQIQMFIAIFYI